MLNLVHVTQIFTFSQNFGVCRVEGDHATGILDTVI